MKQPLFISNIPVDEKRIAFIERVVSRLARRAQKTASAIITPYPISSCTTGDDIRGDVLRYMFAGKGTINKGLIVLGSRPSVGVVVNMSISNDAGGNAKNYVVTTKTAAFEPGIKVYSGDRLSISVEPVDGEKDKITEVWIAFTWIPDVTETEVRKCLIDSLDGELDDPTEE